jgi:hypothetical protein
MGSEKGVRHSIVLSLTTNAGTEVFPNKQLALLYPSNKTPDKTTTVPPSVLPYLGTIENIVGTYGNLSTSGPKIKNDLIRILSRNIGINIYQPANNTKVLYTPHSKSRKICKYSDPN